MARITRAGGLIWLENEPVGRAACLYLYNCNRPESYTRYEQALADAELLRLVSSPFHGTRPEEMFAMVENDRIPLDLFLTELQAACSLDYLHLDTSTTCQAFEKRLAAISERHPNDAAVRLVPVIAEAFERARRDDWVVDAIGMREPTRCEIHTVAQRFADAYRAVQATRDKVARQRAEARLYGAALQAKLRRAEDGKAESNEVFRRQPKAVNGCWLDTEGRSGAAFIGMRAQLPDVHAPANEAHVQALFGPLGWATVTEQFGAISLTNLGDSARVPAPDAARAILLMRLYTVPLSDAPYTISIRQGNRLVTEALVAQAESRLLRGLVHAGDGDIFVEHFDMRGRPLAIERNLRVSVLQMLSLAADG